jgi:hypothetical protein
LDMQAIEAGESLYLTKSEINPLLLERGIRYAIERKQIEQALAAAYEALAEANALFIQVETGAGPPIARASQAGFFPFAESQPHS